MSRSPVREALRDLESEGVVVSYPGRGTFVATITPYDVEEIYELRAMFEEYALRKAFNRITKEELDQAEANFTAPNEPFDWEQCHKADRSFHQLYIDKCGSRRLIQFLRTLNFQKALCCRSQLAACKDARIVDILCRRLRTIPETALYCPVSWHALHGHSLHRRLSPAPMDHEADPDTGRADAICAFLPAHHPAQPACIVYLLHSHMELLFQKKTASLSRTDSGKPCILAPSQRCTSLAFTSEKCWYRALSTRAALT